MTEPSALARFFGAAMIAVGALITLLSGACTGWFVVLSITNLFSVRHDFELGTLLFSLAVGAPFIAIGLALVVQGRRLFSSRR